MGVRVFVGNIPYETTEAELREHFSAIGPVSSVFLPLDRETGRPRGFAFLEFSQPEHAEEAIRRFNAQPFKGRPLAVNEARSRDSRPLAAGPGGPPPRAPWTGPAEEPPRAGSARRFGPDAKPARARPGGGRGPKQERRAKGPIRERGGGRIFSHDGDDSEGSEPDIDDLATSPTTEPDEVD